jgi:hypothetical protein
MQVKQIIKNKISEHENIVIQILKDLDNLSNEMQTLTKNAQNENKIKFFLTQKVILKDKVIFHKAAIETLRDLEKEITADGHQK